MGVVSFFVSADAVTSQTKNQLRTVALQRSAEVTNFIDSVRNDITVTAASSTTPAMVSNLSMGWSMLPDPQGTLSTAFQAPNVSEEGGAETVDFAGLNNGYDLSHRKYHPAMRAKILRQGYSDAYIVTPDGSVLYSVMKLGDFAMKLKLDQEDLDSLAAASTDALMH
jgi:methyl-accepting chemotaxis protein